MQGDFTADETRLLNEWDEIKANLHDLEWRIKNLYYIKNVRGEKEKFTPNWAQIDFMRNLHHFNVILKARQLGFTTLIDLVLLDHALFNPNQHCGIIAQGLKEANDIFDNKVKFAYDNLHPGFAEFMPELRVLVNNTTEFEFANGSKITVGLSLRSGTFQKLHVSEYGKVSATLPHKAKEIKTGAFNTVHAGQQIFVESTAEGQSGEFFELVKLARKLEEQGVPLSPMQPKFHFYPWYKNPTYAMPTGDALRIVIDDEDLKYFRELEDEHHISLTLEQKAWYVTKQSLMNDDMQREFPTHPDEAFAAGLEGAIYARQMRMLRKMGQITRVPWEPAKLVHTFWDLGSYNYMAIWFFQQVGRERRMIRFYQNTGADLSQYVDYMRDLGYSFGTHYLPHDGNIKKLQAQGGNKTTKEMLSGLGLKNIRIVERTNNVRRDIETVCKPELLKVWFDEVHCGTGLTCLDSYRKVQNKDGVWLDEPRHDEFSDGADAFRTYAMGFKEEISADPVSLLLDEGVMAL